MASMSHSSIALGGASASASDYLRSSTNGVTGVSLRTLGRAMVAATRTKSNLYVTARLKKGKKFDHPWPSNPDPNVKGGVLSYLSEFKPLGSAQKPVTLDFERPLVELEKKIVDVRKMAEETGLDFTEQIMTLETKYRQALKDLYTHLTPIQRVNIARHPNRPTFLDHIHNITDKFMELHGDRAGYDDPAIVTGIGTIDGKRYMFIGHQKGRNTKENIMRNFGMPTPHGYRKALRMMYYADHHGFPIVTFIDTPGAYADLKSEEKGQGEAIANNLRTMFGLKVPILSIVIGEGGSGGALAIGCANKMLMLENAVFYVASPEACAAILWQTSKAAPEAAEKLRITSRELVNLNVADGIIKEPLGGAHADPAWTSQQIKKAINENMNEFGEMSGEELLKHRMAKYRKIGVFIEGVPVEPEKKINMKRRDVASTNLKLEGEVEKLREQILKAKATSSEDVEELSSEVLNEMIEKLRSEIDEEYTKAAKAMGLEERLTATREEFLKANAEEHLMHPALIEKIEKLKEEFNSRLSEAPNHENLKLKLEMLRDFSRAKDASDSASVKREINKRFQEAVARPEVSEKVEAVKAELANSGASSFEELSDELKEKVLMMRRELEAEMVVVLKSMGLELEAVKPNLKDVVEENLVPSENIQEKLEKLNQEITEKIEEVVRTPEIKSMVELLKVETAKASQTADGSQKIEALEQQIKQKIADALSMSGLQEKQKELEKELAAARELAGEESDDDDEDGSGSGKSEIINPSFA
ncbi:unnamed protein product [Eruca vesicaria subsp. sativa]|uniref:acetyl-CoA carboxytransferase n=1 Tax=Eruca vesicaria subsp. sativa TaxID=29727 RepID=A0ABC8M8I0_ERUVS|nr:unnamed protein product [Eruca vesicaria subsp. sativa]